MDRLQAGDTFIRMLHAIDARDWSGVRREFADTVDLNLPSMARARATPRGPNA